MKNVIGAVDILRHFCRIATMQQCFSQSVTIGSRGVKKVVIHEGYKPEQLDRPYNDIALIKFDRSFFPESAKHAKLMPICLPPSSTFKDEDKQGGCLWNIIDQLLARFCSGVWIGETKNL